MEYQNIVKMLNRKHIKLTKDETFCLGLKTPISENFIERLANDIKICCPVLVAEMRNKGLINRWYNAYMRDYKTGYHFIKHNYETKIPKHEIEFIEKALLFYGKANRTDINFKKINRHEIIINKGLAECIFFYNNFSKQKVKCELFVGTTGNIYIKNKIKYGNYLRLKFCYQYYTYQMQGFFLQRELKKELTPLLKELKSEHKKKSIKLEKIIKEYEDECSKYLVIAKL